MAIVVFASCATGTLWVLASQDTCHNVGCVGAGAFVSLIIPGALWLATVLAVVAITLLPTHWFASRAAAARNRWLWLKVLGVCWLGLAALYAFLLVVF